MVFKGNSVIEFFLVIIYVAEYVMLVLVIVFDDGKMCEGHFFAGYTFSVCLNKWGYALAASRPLESAAPTVADRLQAKSSAEDMGRRSLFVFGLGIGTRDR